MASSTTTLTAADGFAFSAYVAEPSGTPRGAVVVIQEIFGVNSHIRAVADGYAAQGYLAVAPETFARVQKGVDLGYTGPDMQQGVALKAAVEALPAPGVMQDIQAAVTYASRGGKVGIVGYCYGGLLVWRAAALVQGLSAATVYYGGGATTEAEIARKPQVPVIAHFASQDDHISLESVEALKKAHPDVPVYVYDAHHGFNCDQRGSYDAPSAKLALKRTLAFFEKHLR